MRRLLTLITVICLVAIFVLMVMSPALAGSLSMASATTSTGWVNLITLAVLLFITLAIVSMVKQRVFGFATSSDYGGNWTSCSSDSRHDDAPNITATNAACTQSTGSGLNGVFGNLIHAFAAATHRNDMDGQNQQNAA